MTPTISTEAKKELIEFVKEKLRTAEFANSKSFGKPLWIVAIEAIDSFPTSEPDSRCNQSANAAWIPVTERLPELHQEGGSPSVLSCDIEGIIRENCYFYGDELEEGEWSENETEVTHWQPLPPPPTIQPK